MIRDCSRGIVRSKWFLPSFSLALGLAVGGLAYLLAVAYFRWRH